MGTTNKRPMERAAKAGRREREADAYDPHFPVKRRTPPPDRAETFDPYFLPVRQN